MLITDYWKIVYIMYSSRVVEVKRLILQLSFMCKLQEFDLYFHPALVAGLSPPLPRSYVNTGGVRWAWMLQRPILSVILWGSALLFPWAVPAISRNPTALLGLPCFSVCSMAPSLWDMGPALTPLWPRPNAATASNEALSDAWGNGWKFQQQIIWNWPQKVIVLKYTRETESQGDSAPGASADLKLLPGSWPVAVPQGPPDTPSSAALEPPLFSKSVPQCFATLRWENVFFLFHLQVFSSAPGFNCS